MLNIYSSLSLTVKACSGFWEIKRDLVLFSHHRLAPHTRCPRTFITLSISNYCPVPQSRLCSPLFVVSQECSANSRPQGEQNVFGGCPVSNRIVLIVSWLSFCQMSGPFPVSVLWLGRARGSKRAPWRAAKGAVEDGVRALFDLSEFTITCSRITAHCTHLQRGMWCMTVTCAIRGDYYCKFVWHFEYTCSHFCWEPDETICTDLYVFFQLLAVRKEH